MSKSIQEILDEQRRTSKIYTASNHEIAASERKLDPGYTDWKNAQREKTIQQFSDLETRKTHSVIMTEVAQRPEWKTKQEKAQPWKAFEKRELNEEYKKSRVERNKRLGKDPNWLKANHDAMLKRSRAIQTPKGVFETVNDAVVYYYENKLTTRTTIISIRTWMKHLCKQLNSGFYYITREEYERLTNNPPKGVGSETP